MLCPVSERLLMYSSVKDNSPFAELIKKTDARIKFKGNGFRKKLRPSKKRNTYWMDE